MMAEEFVDELERSPELRRRLASAVVAEIAAAPELRTALLRDVLTREYLEEFRNEVVNELRALRDEVMAVSAGLADLRERLAGLEARMATKEELAKLRAEMATKDDLAKLREEIAELRGRVSELSSRIVGVEGWLKISLVSIWLGFLTLLIAWLFPRLFGG